jgi:hypothetical protein
VTDKRWQALGSIKEDLRMTIEAARTVEFIRRLRGSPESAVDLLVENPDIRIPPVETRGFAPVEPIRGEGMPASRLLIADRR